MDYGFKQVLNLSQYCSWFHLLSNTNNFKQELTEAENK